METVRIWWKTRSPRDRRALTILSLVVPVILCWYLVTLPLLDRREVARRVLETRRNEAVEVQKLLQEYALLRMQIDGSEFKASASVVSELEQLFNTLPASAARPLLNRANVVISGKNQPAAHLRIDKAKPRDFWQLLAVVASSGVCLAEFEISASERANEFAATLKAWLPEKK